MFSLISRWSSRDFKDTHWFLLGFIDFSCIEKNSKFIITDSGTVQEEASILNKLCLVFRDATERPETIENGDTLLINKDFQNLNKIKRALLRTTCRHEINEYKTPNVSNIVSNIINSDILLWNVFFYIFNISKYNYIFQL